MAGHWFFTTTDGKRASGAYGNPEHLCEDFKLTEPEQAVLIFCDQVTLDNGNTLHLQHCDCPNMEYCGEGSR